MNRPIGLQIMAIRNPVKSSYSEGSLIGASRLWILGLVALWVYATYAHLFFGDYQANIALRGFSALDFTNSVLFPENFTRDYPGGAWSAGNSLLVWLYPVLASIGIPAEYTLIGMVGLEIFVVVFGATHLMLTLFRNPHPLALLLLSALMALSWIRYSDLARFSSPFFHGQFYGFADGLRLLAISFYLSDRHKLSSFTMLVGFTIHPIKTIFGFVFVAAVHVGRGIRLNEIKILWPYMLFVAFGVFWAWHWLGLGQSGNAISSQEFFLFSSILNSHWYTQNLGILGERHWQYMTPYLASIMISIAILIRSELDVRLVQGLLFGISVILLVTLLGLALAWNEVSVTLVKISLQRASLLSLSISVILLVAQTVRDLYEEKWWYALLGLSLIVVAFFTNVVWPVVIAIFYLVSTLKDTSNRGVFPVLRFAAVIMILLIFGYQFWLLAADLQNKRFWVDQFKILLFVILVYLLFKAVKSRFNPEVERRWLPIFKPGILILVLLVGTSVWATGNRQLAPSFVEQARNYKEVQEWARQNTPNATLFMLDPCQAYGWRDFSRRSSFGSIHEWYKSGWLYTGDRKAFDEGLRRGSSLGTTLDSILRADTRSGPGKNHHIICKQARTNYYLASGEIVRLIAADYDVEFVVMDKVEAGKYGGVPAWPVSFENQRYAVLIPPQKQDNL